MNLADLMACALCREALTEHHDGGSVSYRHPVAEKDHPVTPISAALLRDVFHRCHTCSTGLPVWDYRTGLIQLLAVDAGVVQTYNDHWQICYPCAQIIEADDIDALTARCASLVGWRFGSIEYTQLNLLHRGIVLGREDRTLLATTPWPPARIAADMLPKVRDRFTGLLRGSVRLPDPINEPTGRRRLADQLDVAPMYWVNDEFTGLVTAVSTDQPTARLTDEIAPTPDGLIVWAEPVSTRKELAAVSWTRTTDGWRLIGYRSIGTAVPDTLMPQLRHEIGWLLPIHTEHLTRRAAIDGDHPLSPLVTTWLLIHQQMADTVATKLPNGTIRAYQRSRRPAPEVRTVRIKPRTTTTAEPDQRRGSTRTRAKPDHRFWVSGHERQQAYGPGRSLRRPVDIQPFLKGDEHLPIKLSTTVRVLRGRPDTGNSTPE